MNRLSDLRRRWLPSLPLSVTVFCFWLLMNGQINTGHIGMALLLGYGITMSIAAAPLLDYTRAAAAQLQSPASYVEQVRAAAPTLREP